MLSAVSGQRPDRDVQAREVMYVPTFSSRTGGFVGGVMAAPPTSGDGPLVGPAGPDVTVVIPTFGRHQVLLDTIERALATDPPPAEVIVVDQTPDHPPAVTATLRRFADRGAIRWIRVRIASQPAAMNLGLLAARTQYVLFHDDDVVQDPGIVGAVARAIQRARGAAPSCWCVCGQVIQPEQTVVSIDSSKRYFQFPFNSDRACFLDDAMAGNLCVHRQRAIDLGGFDENFLGAAYRCETEFARRVVRAGGKVYFEPSASLRHLRAPTGGVRVHGDNRRTWRPYFPVGSYYIALRTGAREAVRTALWLPWRASATRYHVRHPWFIPVTFTSNCLGLGLALSLWARGPRLISRARARASSFASELVRAPACDAVPQRTESS